MDLEIIKKMKKNELLNKIIPNVDFRNGFILENHTFPYYSFCEPNIKGSWSNKLAENLEEHTKNHFIDIYNRKIVLKAINNKINKNSVIIDIGCSSGYMLEDIIKNFTFLKNIFGADFFSAGLIHCHKRLPEIPLFQLDILNCQFEDNIFDIITCLNVLEHIDDDLLALKNIHRILKPGGTVVITVPMGANLYDLYDEVHLHKRRYTIKELKDKINNAGFKIIKLNFFGFFIYPAFYIIKKINKIKYDKLSLEKKKEITFKQITKTERSKIMEMLCGIEYSLGKILRYPFGIRGYIIASK